MDYAIEVLEVGMLGLGLIIMAVIGVMDDNRREEKMQCKCKKGKCK